MDSRLNTAYCILFAFFAFESLSSETLAVNLSDGEAFDFIVVGGGTGGCVVAARLAENGKHSVLLISEGGLPHPDLEIPALATNSSLTRHPSITKVYESAPQRNAGFAWNGTIRHVVGKQLGGGSGVNMMWLNRGHPEIYNDWARITKDDSWKYSNLLKYFRKLETYGGPNPSDQRGFNGPIPLSFPNYAPSLSEWFQAGKELGYPIGDPNGPQTESFTWADIANRNGRRVNSFTGYIGPMLNSASQPLHHTQSPRSNLLILIDTTANRIIFEGNRAVGVKFTSNSTAIGYARANKEIILAAGTVDTAAILMRSGVGPKSVLDKANVTAVKYLQVGRNLQEHVGSLHTIILGNASAAYVPERDLTPEAWRIYEQTGKGPYSSILGAGGQAFISSSISLQEEARNWPTTPDIQFIPMNTNSTIPVSSLPVLDPLGESEIAVRWNNYLVRPKSRGTVTLDPTNIDNPPIIDYQFLTHPDDMRVIIEGLKILIKVCEETSGFQKIGCRHESNPLPACSHLQFRSDSYWECYVRQITITGLHAAGTCRMGSGPEDPEAVVDSQLRVIGIEGIAISDASVIGIINNANTMGAVYVIAEKAADMILKRWENNHNSNINVHPLLNLYY